MRIKSRRLEGHSPLRLLNASGVGEVVFDPDGTPQHIRVLTAEGTEVEFKAG
ncbi:hypothetical protein [Dongshaea marina]|uniref:hypothetical protein n=1 Tax=Dongshaea marina TaxID=2047966 RepID=UPI001900D516|nr:hypothetical protein [Dongshaea marina]